MSRWNVKTSTLILLGSVVFIVLLLVVLPNVDPPDTAFHRGTAPVVVHAQATATPPATPGNFRISNCECGSPGVDSAPIGRVCSRLSARFSSHSPLLDSLLIRPAPTWG